VSIPTTTRPSEDLATALDWTTKNAILGKFGPFSQSS
jgi:hypothetical protein